MNKSQSTNDVFPTAMHIAIALETRNKLLPSLELLNKELKKKITQFKNIIKVGRTHLQDATPITIDQEFGGYLNQVKNAFKRIKIAYEELLYLAQGGTAVGTGINTSTKFIKGFIKAIQIITNLPFKESKNKF